MARAEKAPQFCLFHLAHRVALVLALGCVGFCSPARVGELPARGHGCREAGAGGV